MWRLSFLVVALADCPKFTESKTEAMECVEEVEEGFVLHPCPANYSCPVAGLNHISAASCKADVIVDEEERECARYQALDEICDARLKCGWNLYCSKGFCKRVKKWGQRCTNSSECREGTVCNKGRCELLFALEEGEEADSRTACASARIFNGTCAAASLTIGPLPRKCNEDFDCISTAQKVGSCTCAANSAGQAFCTLHESDPPILEFLAAMRSEKYELAETLMTFAVFFPVVAGTEGGWRAVIEEVTRNRTAFEYWQRCSAGSLAAAALLWL